MPGRGVPHRNYPKLVIKQPNDMERCRRMPPLPRLVLGGMVLLPLVSEDWHVVADYWVVPGGGIRSTEELKQTAARRRIFFQLITDANKPKGQI